MRISRHDLRRRYSNSLVIDAGSQFSLRACSQATHAKKVELEYLADLRLFDIQIALFGLFLHPEQAY